MMRGEGGMGRDGGIFVRVGFGTARVGWLWVEVICGGKGV